MFPICINYIKKSTFTLKQLFDAVLFVICEHVFANENDQCNVLLNNK